MAASTRVPATAVTPTRRLSAAVGTVVAAVVLLAGAAGAQDYPPRAVIDVTTPGATMTIESPNADWGPGTRVRVSYEAPNGAQATKAVAVDEDGSFATELDVPADAEPGVSTVTVSGVDADGQAQRWEPEVLVQEDAPVVAGAGDDGTEAAQAGDVGAGGAAADPDDADEPDDPASAAAGLPTTGDATGLGVLAAVLLVLVGSAAVMGAQILGARRRGLDR